jgi:uncharacterized protein
MDNIRLVGYRRQFQDTLPKIFPELQDGINGVLVKNITFLVTEACPLRCTYCYECNKDHTRRMSKETAKKAVDLILSPDRTNGYIDLANDKGVIIEFIGGEPLLEADLLVYISDYFKQQLVLLNHPWRHHYMFSVTTNGVPWKDPKFKEFLLKNSGRVSVSVTVDGDRELHDACRVFPDGKGSYQDAVDAVAFCRKYVRLNATKATFAPGNVEYISKAIPHLFELGFTDVNANCVYEEGWNIENTRVFYRELIKLADYMVDKEIYKTSYCSIFDQTIGIFQGDDHTNNWCGGNAQMLAIGTDGRLFPCIRFMTHSLSTPGLPEMEIGDVDRGIDAPMQSKCIQCLANITRQSQSKPECLDCPVSSGCGWCTGYNYDKFGDPNVRATFICWPHRARCMANAYYWNRIKEKTGFDAGVEDNVLPEHREMILRGGNE